jgi:BirA family biotin operon repressor/biotin-[acetyl-CoA-carboxylase] ligase
VVLGIGVIVSRAAVPAPYMVNFPAGCVEEALGRPVARAGLLREILSALIAWTGRLGTPEFLAAWQARLAFTGEAVQVIRPEGEQVQGRVAGLTREGHLRLWVEDEERVFSAGEIHLRPHRLTTEGK